MHAQRWGDGIPAVDPSTPPRSRLKNQVPLSLTLAAPAHLPSVGGVADPVKLEPLKGASNDDVLNAFLNWLVETGVDPYDHQEEAILELFDDKNVILNTPTGSGKSLVALAVHYRGLCLGRRSFYTVPIKALANEKFLSLCRTFGPENVGMITGDATVNRDAPIICCTAEILANIALREGENAQVDDVIIDEFHYYSDHSRGVAWQIPLLALPQSRFLLMSATLGETKFFEDELTTLTGAETVLVKSDQRPVPLEFIYSETPLAEMVESLVQNDKAPVYLVHFAQRACAETAQSLTSVNFCSKEEKREIAEALHEANFRSPYGKEVSKLLRHGIGIHHAGLLPKYRVLVEKLTQRGLLKVICGTDTLGVGVNVPIRTVVFTQLCKFDGQGTKILTVRDFKQVAGRAGRRGFDNIGYVVAQAPEHVIENKKLEAKAAASTKKRKLIKKKPPEKGYVAWDESTFRKLISSPSEKLVSRFKVSHSMLLNVMARKDKDGCAELKRVIAASHETDQAKRKHRRQAFAMFRGLVRGGVLTIIPEEERTSDVKVRLHVDLPDDFSMNQALGLYLLDVIPQLDRESPTYVLHLLSLVEAILENPMAVLVAQQNKEKTRLINDLKEEGVGYDERMELLEQVEWPKPDKDFIFDSFNRFIETQPWIEAESIRPKSIVREMFEEYMSFEDYVKEYGLERSEAVLLRHLSDVYKVLEQTVPPGLKTDEVLEAQEYLGDLLRGVDSSLLDEWERMHHPEQALEEKAEAKPEKEVPISRSKKAFTRAVRHAIFTVVKELSHDRVTSALTLIEPDDGDGEKWSVPRLDAILDDYYDGHEFIRLDPEARNAKHAHISELPNARRWRVDQVLIDSDEHNDWVLVVEVDLDASDAKGEPVLTLKSLGPIA
ncbi:DEAD/DEAH box helicase [Sulfuriroseicoccus oceanibius]|uniref:DUF3516 domain-containing protein n=1 Tax=Sulfuriroseicoccus oceanibius TaxID=2707525 RepID=A0A6B3LCE1_9BACT|nr:DUF3516 domain-containing protein [Sulfuriroseicoccus oceanibius]QQL45293.1 DUF3516 domain-containing protein [Sulfuriroseicoccus oceanibius]